MRHRKIVFVVADGAHARVLMRDRESGGLKVLAEFHAQSLGLAKPAHKVGTVFESFSHQRHGLDNKTASRRAAKLAFIDHIGQAVPSVLANRLVEGFVTVAPSRLLTALAPKLAPVAPVLSMLGRDLTHLPLAELDQRLLALEASLPSLPDHGRSHAA